METDREKQKEGLDKFVEEIFTENMKKKSLKLNHELKNLIFSRKLLIKYLLARLTQRVEMAFHGWQERDNLRPYMDGSEIEHILPKNPKDALREAWEKRNTGYRYDEMAIRLGNLTLLGKPFNISAGRRPYSEKVLMYRESGYYLTRSLYKLAKTGQGNTSITRINDEYLCSFEKWDAEEIKKRQKLLAKLAKVVWNIPE